MIKAILCDTEGVLLTGETERFSAKYAREKGFDVAELDDFFKNYFPLTLVGKAQLDDVMWQHRQAWHLASKDEMDALLQVWRADNGGIIAENVAAINNAKHNGIFCCASTNQEIGRGEYFYNTVLPSGLFDAIYISAAVGAKKPSKEYFHFVVNDLAEKGVINDPGELLFVDDDQENIDGANEVGIVATLYDRAENLSEILRRLA